MMRKILYVILGGVLSSPSFADISIAGEGSIEQRYFLQDAAYTAQPRKQTSLLIQPEVYADWNNGYDSITFKPFLHLDSEDSERTHADIRELMWLHVGDGWELGTGIGKVFWGQTESLHLVDIINQTDAVEQVDGEDKLGQPMVRFSLDLASGAISAFILPYFRERTFAGEQGRLRPIIPIDTDHVLYESDDEENNIDFALRWQQSLGDWEIGLSYFDGTGREPYLVSSGSVLTGDLSLLPYYPQIQQVGADILYVNGPWLYKFEAISRQSKQQDFWAAVGGFEYTTVGVFGSHYDLGWLAEYQIDERDDDFFAPAQNDLMLGLRWLVNDVDGSEILFGYVQDLDEMSTYSAFVEASSRMTENWRWKVEGYFFSTDVQTDPYFLIRRDDHVQFSVEYYY
jgi:hypothetical protein